MCDDNQQDVPAQEGLSSDRLYAILGGLGQINSDDTLGGCCGGLCKDDGSISDRELIDVAISTFVHLTTSPRDCIALRSAECLLQIAVPGLIFD